MTDAAQPPQAAPTGTPQERLSELVANRRVLVCCGSGGVGKTTTAAVLAMEAARQGRRAVVVTIDPARRLADALGLESLTNAASTIESDWPGRMSALMLDTEKTFDGLVARYANDAEQADRILSNRFYRNIAGALSGTQEYMASEKLYELHAETDFDLVVVDTPPTRNALDFLEAPRQLANFLDHRLYRMLTAPTRGIVKAVNMAAQGFLRSVGKVVGGEVIGDAIAFFAAFEGMEEGFKDRARAVDALLRADETAFLLIASPNADTVGEATFFAEELHRQHIEVRGLVVNRMFPDPGPGSPAADEERAHTLAGTPLGEQYHVLAGIRRVAKGEAANLAALEERIAPAPVCRVPFLPFEVHDLDTLAAFGDRLFGRS